MYTKYRYTNVDIETPDVVLYHICLVLVTVAVGSQLKAGESYDMSVSFTNGPLRKPLTNVIYFVAGAKLIVPLKEERK